MDIRTLYISDLDGTLLNKNSCVSETSASVLNDIIGRGAMFSVATARTPATVCPLLRHIKSSVPAIVMTGAALWDRCGQKYIMPKFISHENAGIILKEFKAAGISPFVYCLPTDSNVMEVFHSAEMNGNEYGFYKARSNLALKRFNIGKEPDSELRQRILLIYGTAPADSIAALAGSLEKLGIGAVSAYPDIFNKDWSLIEVFANGVSKASAINSLRKLTSADRVVVFGDNLNDLPMFGVADTSVAVGNAFEAVRQQADIVIGSNDEDSVARFIAEDFANSGHETED